MWSSHPSKSYPLLLHALHNSSGRRLSSTRKHLTLSIFWEEVVINQETSQTHHHLFSFTKLQNTNVVSARSTTNFDTGCLQSQLATVLLCALYSSCSSIPPNLSLILSSNPSSIHQYESRSTPWLHPATVGCVNYGFSARMWLFDILFILNRCLH